MAVATKTTRFKSNNKTIDVHHIIVNKGNKKGAAAAIGGTLVQSVNREGEVTSWFIDLDTTVNNKPRTVVVLNGDYVFRTGTNNRWQVLSRAMFNKRFSVVK